MKEDIIKVRKASLSDLDAVTDLESRCFPASEAADRRTFEQRLNAYPECFWLLELEDKICSMIGGMTTDEYDLSDSMYEDTSLFKDDGIWMMLFGVETDPLEQHKGYASFLMKEVIKDMKSHNRKGIVLTCKDSLISFYEKFGFINEGISASVHGGAKWYQMRLVFSE